MAANVFMSVASRCTRPSAASATASAARSIGSMNADPRSPGSSRSAISTFWSVSSPKRSSRLFDRARRVDSAGVDARRVDPVPGRLCVDAGASAQRRPRLHRRMRRDGFLRQRRCNWLVWSREEAQDCQRVRLGPRGRVDAGTELEHHVVGRPDVHGVLLRRDDLCASTSELAVLFPC